LGPAALRGAVRGPLYSPAWAAALPAAIDAAAQGQFAPLFGLVSLRPANDAARLDMGMHLAVVCSEDLPRLRRELIAPAAVAEAAAAWDDGSLSIYQRLCSQFPASTLPEAFYSIPAAATPVLLLSGGADPVTPPRHAQRVAAALGRQARHEVVPEAGHGVLGLPCMGEVLRRFIDAPTDAGALAVDAACARQVPRPPAFVPIAVAP
jgi:pimeloyl-ACP methyl ester carboxylesterase